jgi:hypothetical protein
MRKVYLLLFICNKCKNLIFGNLKENYKMTSPKGMDELFWGEKLEDVTNWVERLEIVAKVQGIDEQK